MGRIALSVSRHWSARSNREPTRTVIDGEIVALNGTGRPSFNFLQNSKCSRILAGVLSLRLVDPSGRRFQKRTNGGSPQALKHEGCAGVSRTNSPLGNDSGFLRRNLLERNPREPNPKSLKRDARPDACGSADDSAHLAAGEWRENEGSSAPRGSTAFANRSIWVRKKVSTPALKVQ
jgi:hypothetical protein